MTAFIAELIGTMIIIIFGSGVVAGVVLSKTKSQNSGWIVITFGWGLGVMAAVYAVGKYSGAHLNPAVTLALAVLGKFDWNNVPGYILAQIIGAFFGGIIIYLQYLPHWKKTEDAELKLAVFATGPAISEKYSNLVSEIIGTFVLILGLLSIGANEFSTGLNPLIVGFLIVVIGLSLGGTTGYAINPARDLGPRIAHFLLPIHGKGSSNWTYSWIPILGPVLGGTEGALFYAAIFEGKIYPTFYILTAVILIVMAMAIYKDKQTINIELNTKVNTEVKECI